MQRLKVATGKAIACFLMPVFWSANASAQTDEIQVYDAQIAEPGVFNLMVHNNFTPEGLKMTCHRTFIQQQLESRGFVRRVARVEQRAIGGAGRGCAADRPLR